MKPAAQLSILLVMVTLSLEIDVFWPNYEAQLWILKSIRLYFDTVAHMYAQTAGCDALRGRQLAVLKQHNRSQIRNLFVRTQIGGRIFFSCLECDQNSTTRSTARRHYFGQHLRQTCVLFVLMQHQLCT